MVCIFFGHSDCYGLDGNVLKNAIEDLIRKGADTFYVGNQGYFDGMVFSSLMALKKYYPNISFSVILAYLPTQKSEYDFYRGYSMYPEGQEKGPHKFAIVRRNRWMIEQGKGGYCVCCINHTWGRAYKFVKQAKSRGITIINLGSVEL